MKVVKFGGSSLASAQQIRKVGQIIKSDTERKIVVVSAPGKRYSEDEKVTDLLISLAEKSLQNQDYSLEMNKIVQRYQEMAEELSLNEEVMVAIESHLDQLAAGDKTHPDYYIDAFKASGEDNNAKLVAAYFNQIGIPASYVSPKEAGLL